MEHEALMAAADVARMLGLGGRVLEAWRQRGQGPPFVRLSARCVRYRKADVEAWLAARRITSPIKTKETECAS